MQSWNMFKKIPIDNIGISVVEPSIGLGITNDFKLSFHQDINNDSLQSKPALVSHPPLFSSEVLPI